MIKLYARLEPTRDSVLIGLGLGKSNALTLPSTSTEELLASGYFGKLDVVVYRDPEATSMECRFAWGTSRRPVPNRTKKIRLNCYMWELEWIPPYLPRNDIGAGRQVK